MYLDLGEHYDNIYRWVTLVDFNYYWSLWAFLTSAMFGQVFERFKFQKSGQFHPFHILGPSPWPLGVAISVLLLVSGVIDFFTVEQGWRINLVWGLGAVIFSLWSWWVDVINESLFEHTRAIKFGIGVGMILFIGSEVMFFFSFFWAFFHVSLAPGVEIGCVWPPRGVESIVIDPFGAPLVNTFILVISGLTLTCAHHAFLVHSFQQRLMHRFVGTLMSLTALDTVWCFFRMRPIGGYDWHMIKDRFWALTSCMLGTRFARLKDRLYFWVVYPVLEGRAFQLLISYYVLTLLLAFLFTFYQAEEYVAAAVTISDGVYGSTFFLLTGFHGFHVIVGTAFLTICFVRILLSRISFVQSIGLECAIWYWHFVDVVWLFLFIFLYIWGNGIVPVVALSDVAEGFVAQADFARRWQLGFQNSATVLMEGIVDVHNYIMVYVWLIFGLVFWLLIVNSIFSLQGRLMARFWRFRSAVHIGLIKEKVIRGTFFTYNRVFLKHFGGPQLEKLANFRDKSRGTDWDVFFMELEYRYAAGMAQYRSQLLLKNKNKDV